MGIQATDLYSLGLGLDPSDMVSGGKKAEDALNRVGDAADKNAQRVLAFGQQFKSGASGLLVPSGMADNLAKGLGNTAEKAEGASRGLGKVERALEGIALEAAGANNHFGHLAGALTQFGLGGEVFIAVTAGLAAIGLAWDALTEDSKNAQKAAEDYANSDAVKTARVGTASRIGAPNAEQQAAVNALIGSQSKLLGMTGATEVLQLDRAMVQGKIDADAWEKSLRALGEAQGTNPFVKESIDRAKDLGAAYLAAKVHYEDLKQAAHAPISLDDAALMDVNTESAQKTLDEWDKVFEKVASYNQLVLTNSKQIDSAIDTTINSYVKKLGDQWQAAHDAAHDALAAIGTDIHQEIDGPLALSEQLTKDFITNELNALKSNNQEAERIAREPFKNALRGAQQDFANFFTSVFDGGVNTFGKLAQSIRDTFAKLVGELAAMQLVKKALGNYPDLLKSIGLPAGGGPGALSAGGSTTFSALGAGLGLYSIGTTVGGLTSNTTTGSLLGGILGGVPGAIGGFFGSQAKKHAEEVAQAAKEEEESQARASAQIRALQSAGRTYEAESAQLALQHEQELADARKKGYDAATLAALNLADAAETAAQAADQAKRKQEDAANAIAQEGTLFGESAAQTQAKLAALYGFTGLTKDQILAQYTRGGGELTTQQQQLNEAIQQYVSTYLQSPNSTSSTTLGTVSSISAAQSDAMLGYLSAQLAVQLRIATATESLAGIGGPGLMTPGGLSSSRTIDAALSQQAMTRRAAVGAVRTPSPT